MIIPDNQDTKRRDLDVPERNLTLPGPPPHTRASSNTGSSSSNSQTITVSTKGIPRRRGRRFRIFAFLIVLLSLVFVLRFAKHRKGPRGHPFPKFRPHANRQDRHSVFKPDRLPTIEKTFLSVPNNDSAVAASRRFASKPHMAGTKQDFVTAKMFLDLFQTELGIPKPEDEPLFDAGSKQSQRAIRGTTTIPRRINRPIAWIDTYYPYLNTGTEQKLQVLKDDGSLQWEAKLEEDGEKEDPDARKYYKSIPTWHGLSKDGDVQGPLVSVKYGRKQDFDELLNSGIDLNGTIALVRYGYVFRGLKVKAAQEAGCVGILIYSDPRDDGSVTEDAGYKHWPHGPARNPTSVQRGSVQFLSSYPGDPTTPGYPSYKNASRTDATSIPSIPSLPLSWKNAKRLLKEIETSARGQTTPPTIRLVNKVDNKVTPIYNVMAVIPGLVSEQAVIVGNHRDAWVLGAADPTSGSVCMHELVRGLGVLLRNGWSPLRTIILASWDGEEYGLIGSTEWGEDFADWIQDHVVTYLNLDSAVSGSRYNLKGSPSLAHLLRDAAMSVPYPVGSNLTLWDARLNKGPFTEPALLDRHDVSELVAELAAEELKAEQEELPVAALGSGSDYTVMLQRLGVASTDMGFGSTLSDAVYHYHSVYDSETFQETYTDPGFHKHVAVAQHLGLLTLRIADNPVIPINTTHYTLELFNYLNGVEKLAVKYDITVDTSSLRSALETLLQTSLRFDTHKEVILEELQQVSDKQAQLTNTLITQVKHWFSHRLGIDRRDRPEWDERRHKMGHDMIRDLEAWVLAPEHAPAVELYQSPMVITELGTPPPGPPPGANDGPENVPHLMMRLREVDIRLGRFERGFISESGIKDREWYRHLGVAPGKWKGYGATPFPALSEAIEIERNATLATMEVGRLVEVVETLISTLTPSLSS